MKRKYADMYYSVKKEPNGWIWKIYYNYGDKEAAVSSLENEDEDDKYLDTERAARTDAIHAIQDHYN